VRQDDTFLQAIIGAPEDDKPRLIYADWLDDHGNRVRGEFIRVQCELPRLRLLSRRTELKARERVWSLLPHRDALNDEEPVRWVRNKTRWPLLA